MLAFESWNTYVVARPQPMRGWQWEAEFGATAMILQLCALYVGRWDKAGAIVSQATFTLLLSLWAIGLAGPSRTFDAAWSHVSTLVNVLAVALMMRHWYFLLRALPVRTAEPRQSGSAA